MNFLNKKIVIATGNKGKVKEFESLLKLFDCKIFGLTDFKETQEPEEYGRTFAENALIKARYYSKHTNSIVIADDSGLEVTTLDGKPGIHSARFAINNDGKQDFKFAINKLEELLKAKGVNTKSENDKDKLKANFSCAIAFYQPDNTCFICEGKVYGYLQFPAKGEGGFGYDPIFIPEGYDNTFAEISLEEKQSISHRAKAFEKLKTFLLQ